MTIGLTRNPAAVRARTSATVCKVNIPTPGARDVRAARIDSTTSRGVRTNTLVADRGGSTGSSAEGCDAR
ncbi:Uncharacterised protein [Mycobacteroides abscessus subsp. abscessus]|nr:Uncharacterised protein [Mycobacteroides abscessus subsp. abscessus]